MRKVGSWCVVVVAAWLALPSAEAQRSPEPWTVSASPLVELWARGVALAGLGNGGPLSLYSPAARDTSGAWALLGRDVAGVAPSLVADSAFEVLHFASLPLFAESPAVALRALNAPGGGSIALMRTRAALEQSLPALPQRRALAAFVRALDNGWRNGGADAWSRGAAERRAQLATLQARWRTDFVPRLLPLLQSLGIHGGVLLVQPAIGREGRVLDDEKGMLLIVVGEGPGDAPLLAAVREICFPLVRRALGQDRAGDAAVIGDHAAVRCGEMMIERALPARRAAYQALYGAAGDSALAARFPIPPAAERALRQAVQRATGS